MLLIHSFVKPMIIAKSIVSLQNVKQSDLCRLTAKPDSTSPGEMKQSHSPPLFLAKDSERSRETCSRLWSWLNARDKVDLEKSMQSDEMRFYLFHYFLNESLLILNGNSNSSIIFNRLLNDSFIDPVWYLYLLNSSFTVSKLTNASLYRFSNDSFYSRSCWFDFCSSSSAFLVSARCSVL